MLSSIIRIDNNLVRQDVGKDLQKMRLTAPKEAGNPDTHFVCPSAQSTFVSIEETVHILA